MKHNSKPNLLVYLLQKYPWKIEGFDSEGGILFIIGVGFGAILTGAWLCSVSGLLCTVWIFVTFMCGLATVKMYDDKDDIDTPMLYYVYLCIAELMSLLIVIHILWWLINMPINISRFYRGY